MIFRAISAANYDITRYQSVWNYDIARYRSVANSDFAHYQRFLYIEQHCFVQIVLF